MSVIAAPTNTLEKLGQLESLYRQGYRSDVVDRTVDKLLVMESVVLQREIFNIQEKLQRFEKAYQLPSHEFFQRFEAGLLGDSADFVEWSAFYEMSLSLQENQKALQALSS